MKLNEAIKLYRSKEKSDYPAENRVRLGQYLEPHLDDIEFAQESINNLRDRCSEFMVQKKNIAKRLAYVISATMKNSNSTKQDLVNAIDSFLKEWIKENP